MSSPAEIYPLSLHDALPIFGRVGRARDLSDIAPWRNGFLAAGARLIERHNRGQLGHKSGEPGGPAFLGRAGLSSDPPIEWLRVAAPALLDNMDQRLGQVGHEAV